MKIIIIGGPRSGKSTLAKKLANKINAQRYCTDPKSLVKDIESNVNYLPDGIPWGDDSTHIINNWFSKEGDWIIEGVGAVRALRKWAQSKPPCDKIIFIKESFPGINLSKGQASMHKSISTIWGDIEDRYKSITQII